MADALRHSERKLLERGDKEIEAVVLRCAHFRAEAFNCHVEREALQQALDRYVGAVREALVALGALRDDEVTPGFRAVIALLRAACREDE